LAELKKEACFSTSGSLLLNTVEIGRFQRGKSEAGPSYVDNIIIILKALYAFHFQNSCYITISLILLKFRNKMHIDISS